MKGLDWAKFYDEYHEKVLDIKAMEKQIIDLIGDDEDPKTARHHPVCFDR